MLSDATLAFGEQVTPALLGVDALYRAEPIGENDWLVVVNMSTTHRPEPFADYAVAHARFNELAALASTLPEADRRLYYTQLCASTMAFIDWRAKGLPFTDQLARFLHVPATPVSDAELDGLRAEMHRLLSTMGYDGSLHAQCLAWEARTRVPGDEVAGTMTALMDEAWDRTDARFPIPADKSDGMRIATVSNVAFNARCDYLSRTVELNIDPILTTPALKHLVVHEGYPGHYVQFKLRETWYREGSAPADGLLSVVNTASSCTFEGIADNGIQLIDWLDTDDDRCWALITRYRSAIGTVAAWRLHALGHDEAAVTAWLQDQSLTGGEGWAANRMRFIGAPDRAVLIWSYWWGEASVTPVWLRQPKERRQEFLRYLYGRLHSTQSVALFA